MRRLPADRIAARRQPLLRGFSTTTSLPSCTSVSTSICSDDFRLPTSFACLRRRWIASSTPAWSAVNAWPSSVVQLHFQAHHVDRFGKLDECPHRRREANGSRGVIQRRGLELLVLQQPVARVEHLLRIGRRNQDLRQHRIRVERDGREQFFERLGVPRGRCCRLRACVHGGRRRLASGGRRGAGRCGRERAAPWNRTPTSVVASAYDESDRQCAAIRSADSHRVPSGPRHRELSSIYVASDPGVAAKACEAHLQADLTHAADGKLPPSAKRAK